MHEEIHGLLAQLQFTHWWFNGRRRVVGAFLARRARPGAGADVLDIGSGHGALVPELQRFGTVDAAEPYAPAQEQLRALGVREIMPAADALLLRPARRYDIVALGDVLEHVPDDAALLRAVREHCLKPGGHILFTVPAYRWMWSALDDKAGHRRRYTRTMARQALAAAGYTDIAVSHFMCLLFPLAAASRLLRPRSSHDLAPVAPWLNTLLQAVFALEAPLIRRGNLPCGLSVIAAGTAPV